MVRLFETRQAYNTRMKKRSSILKSNANLVKLIKEYRNTYPNVNKRLSLRAHVRKPNFLTPKIETNIHRRALKVLKNHGVNAQRNFNFNAGFYKRLQKILAAVPNTRNHRVTTPKYVRVNQPNGNVGLGRINFRSN